MLKQCVNYGNRLYVANYKEESRKLDISKIDTSNIRVGDLFRKRMNTEILLIIQ